MPRTPGQTTITVSTEIRDELAELAAVSGGLAKRRVTMAEALRAAVRSARRHPDEVTADLAEGTPQ